MQTLKDNKEQAREESFKKELLDKLFPEKAEFERLKSLKETKSAGAIKAQIVIRQLFNSRPAS